MVLDDLYCGNIYLAEQVVPHEKEYRKLHGHTGELFNKLEKTLQGADGSGQPVSLSCD